MTGYLVLVVRTVRLAVAHRRLRYAAAVVADEAIVRALVIRIAALVIIRCKTKRCTRLCRSCVKRTERLTYDQRKHHERRRRSSVKVTSEFSTSFDI